FFLVSVSYRQSTCIIDVILEKLKLQNALLGRVYVIGIMSLHTWSPYFAAVFLVVYSLQIPIYQYLPYGLLLCFFQVLSAFLIFIYLELRYIQFHIIVFLAVQNRIILLILFILF